MMGDRDLSRRNYDRMTKPSYSGEESGRRGRSSTLAVLCLLATTPIASNMLATSFHHLQKFMLLHGTEQLNISAHHSPTSPLLFPRRNQFLVPLHIWPLFPDFVCVFVFKLCN